MLNALRKSKQISFIVLDRLGDYLALLRIELKLQGRELMLQLLGLFAAVLCAFYALLFVGMAIIISFWDSEYRAIAAWATVAVYMGLAGAGMTLAKRHTGKAATLNTLREEIKRDADLLRESI